MSVSTKRILSTIATIQEAYPGKTFGDIIVGLLDYVDSNGPGDQLDWLGHADNSDVLKYLSEYERWGELEKDENGFFTGPPVLQFYKGPKLCSSCGQPKGCPHRTYGTRKCPWDK